MKQNSKLKNFLYFLGILALGAPSAVINTTNTQIAWLQLANIDSTLRWYEIVAKGGYIAGMGRTLKIIGGVGGLSAVAISNFFASRSIIPSDFTRDVRLVKDIAQGMLFRCKPNEERQRLLKQGTEEDKIYKEALSKIKTWLAWCNRKICLDICDDDLFEVLQCMPGDIRTVMEKFIELYKTHRPLPKTKVAWDILGTCLSGVASYFGNFALFDLTRTAANNFIQWLTCSLFTSTTLSCLQDVEQKSGTSAASYITSIIGVILISGAMMFYLLRRNLTEPLIRYFAQNDNRGVGPTVQGALMAAPLAISNIAVTFLDKSLGGKKFIVAVAAVLTNLTLALAGFSQKAYEKKTGKEDPLNAARAALEQLEAKLTELPRDEVIEIAKQIDLAYQEELIHGVHLPT